MTTVMEYRKWDGAGTTRPGLRANGYTGVYVSWNVGPCRLEQQNVRSSLPCVSAQYLMQFPTGLQWCFRDATRLPARLCIPMNFSSRSIDTRPSVYRPQSFRWCTCVCVWGGGRGLKVDTVTGNLLSISEKAIGILVSRKETPVLPFYSWNASEA